MRSAAGCAAPPVTPVRDRQRRAQVDSPGGKDHRKAQTTMRVNPLRGRTVSCCWLVLMEGIIVEPAEQIG